MLDTPFLYDPSQGNLLLDWINLGGENFGFLLYDSVDTAGDATSRLFAGPAGSATGTANTQGLVVEFLQVIGDEPRVVEILDATGNGTSGLDDPFTPVVASDGNVFVAGRSDNLFRVAPDGTITEILDATGDGANGFDRFVAPP